MKVNICTVLIFDRSTCAIAAASEVFQPQQVARKVLGREPDSTNDGLVSWGAITPEEIRRMMLSGEEPDQDGADEVDTWESKYGGDGFLWSLFTRSDDVE